MKNISRILMIIVLLCLTVTMAVSCDLIFGEPAPDPNNDHVHELSEVAEVAASCTEAGTKAYYKCSGCDKLFADAEGATEIEAPEAIAALGHTEKVVAGKAATCTEAGLTDGVICTVCNTTITAQEEIPVANHTEETVAGKDATCTETGLTEGKKCSVCGTTLVEQKEIPVANHTEEIVAGKDATCTATGLTDGKKCSVCGTTLVAQETIAAKGHKDDDNNFKCDACQADLCTSHTPTEAVEENVVPETCTENGSYDKVVYCSVCGVEISRETKTTTANGHTEVTTKENEVNATCTENGSYDTVVSCSVCHTELSRETTTITAPGHTEEVVAGKAATCTETGLTEGKKCTACKQTLVEQTVIAALGHTEKTVEGKAATCTATGLTDGVICTVCNTTITAQEVIPVADHTEEVVAGYAATCTEAGLSDGKKCSVCGETIVAQEAIGALGHTEVVDAAVAATSATTGLTEGKHCSVCSEVLVAQEVVSILKVTINATGEYVFEAENLDLTNLTPASGWESRGVQIETPTTPNPATSGGKSVGACGGGYTTITLVLEDKASVQIMGRLAQANGGAASKYMSVMLEKHLLEPSGDLLVGDDATSKYWNWTDIPFGSVMDLEAGTYTLKIMFKSANLDCFKFNVLTYGEFDTTVESDLEIDAEGIYTVEAESIDKTNLVLRQDFIDINKYTYTESWSNDFGSGTCLMGYTSGSVIKLYVDVKEANTIALSMRMSYYGAATFDFSNTTITFAGQTLTPTPAGDFGHREASDYWMWVEVDLGQVDVEAGVHLFEINFTECDNHNIDYFRFVTVNNEAPACETVCATCGLCLDADCVQLDHLTKCEGHYDVVISENTAYTLEAENWSQDGMVLRSDLANHASKDGNRLLENSGTTIGGMAAGSYVSFKVNVKADSTVAFVMKGAHSVSCVINQAMSLTIDGVEVELCDLDILGSGSAPWFDWSIFTMGYANIPAGEHTIVLTFDKLSPNIDYLKLDVMSYGSYSDSDITLATTGTTKYQLETIDCTQCLINTRSDFVSAVGAGNCGKGSGRIYGYADGSIFRVMVTVEEACTIQISLAGFGGTALNAQSYSFGGTVITPAEDAVLGSGSVAEGVVGTVQVTEAGVYCFEFTSGVSTDLDYVAFTIVE